MYSPGYIIGYSYLATAHMWAGQWCRIYELHFKYNNHNNLKKDRDDNLYEELKNLVGQSSLYFLESNYQYEMAIQNYHNVLQMHNEGAAYKNKLCNLYFLEDDYNDNLTHFNISFERYQVNTKQIRNRIDQLSEIVFNDKTPSKIYIYENYTSTK